MTQIVDITSTQIDFACWIYEAFFIIYILSHIFWRSCLLASEDVCNIP